MYTIKGKIRHLWMLYKFLKKRKFDTFHTNVDLFNGPQLLIAQLVGIKNRVCHSHNSNQVAGFESQSKIIKLYQQVMKYLCKVSSTRRCGCSQEAMDFLFPFKWKDNSYPQIVYNGIELAKFQKIIDVVAKRQSVGLVASKHIIVVGHIGFQKNPLMTVEIFREVCKCRSDIDLIWIGKGEMQEVVVEKLKKYNIVNRVHFLGQRVDVNEILQCADLFLFPSLFEGLGIAIVEAQAAGLPCIASDQVPALANCGKVETLSLSVPPDVWAKEVIRIIDHPNDLKIDDALLSNFTMANMANQMQLIYTPPCE
jgi:glycosyltransferase involved in cell wall biosynthesis